MRSDVEIVGDLPAATDAVGRAHDALRLAFGSVPGGPWRLHVEAARGMGRPPALNVTARSRHASALLQVQLDEALDPEALLARTRFLLG